MVETRQSKEVRIKGTGMRGKNERRHGLKTSVNSDKEHGGVKGRDKRGSLSNSQREQRERARRIW